jgi:nitrite reductase (cytochrome c-552)
MDARTRTWLIFAVTVVGTVLVLALLINIFQRQQEARVVYPRVVEIPDNEPDPDVWGRNFASQYDRYMRTIETSTFEEYSRYGRYGGSEAFSKLDLHPNYRRIFAGYSFGIEYREERGHLHALDDMLASQRLGDQKPGPCMTCKSSHVPGLIQQLGAAEFYRTPVREMMERFDIRHSITCADCHRADTMELQITRPAFREAMERRGISIDRATHQEMRAYVCAQCHVEYYFRPDDHYLVFPWDNGLRLEEIESYFDGIGFSDWVHAESGASLVKIQHPEFELWSTGIHARSGVTCVDCHMPFMREGAAKITDHWIATPLTNVNRSCIPCHRQAEREMRERTLEIQDRTHFLLTRSELAIIAAIDSIKAAMEAGVTDAELEGARRLHRRAHIRWDFISAENSMGFHSGGEANRILGDSIDFARQAELAAYRALVARTGRPAAGATD